MSLPPLAWHNRFQQQARWTENLRDHLLAQVALGPGSRLLEVGCGTGAVLANLPAEPALRKFGLDINAGHLKLATRHAPRTALSQADAHGLPYRSGAFAVTLCHFVLLWLKRPDIALAEMARVTQPGGAVLVLAEPDYGGRIDFPEALALMGTKQAQALEDQGADPYIGRRLAALLIEAGLHEVESGVLGGRWTTPPSQAELTLEWEIMRSDLSAFVTEGELDEYQAADQAAWARGERILYVPTFYAWGRRR